MLSELWKNKRLFYQLYNIDKETAQRYRQWPCPHCGGPLLPTITANHGENLKEYLNSILFNSAFAVVPKDVAAGCLRLPPAFWEEKFTGLQ